METQATIIIQVNSELEPLMPNFLNNRQSDIANLTAALNKGDFETIQRLGHSMRGVGAGYGFDYISELGEKLEMAAIYRSAETIAVDIKALATYLSRITIFYSEEF